MHKKITILASKLFTKLVSLAVTFHLFIWKRLSRVMMVFEETLTFGSTAAKWIISGKPAHHPANSTLISPCNCHQRHSRHSCISNKMYHTPGNITHNLTNHCFWRQTGYLLKLYLPISLNIRHNISDRNNGKKKISYIYLVI